MTSECMLGELIRLLVAQQLHGSVQGSMDIMPFAPFYSSLSHCSALMSHLLLIWLQ